VRFELVDPLGGDRWPIGAVDAALCLDCVGWGSDADQRRLFRRLRRQLVDEGVLIVGCTPFWLTGLQGLETEYDRSSGRTRGTLRTAEGPLRHDVRLYSTVELRTLVREAGFQVVSADGGRLVARALPAPPRSLAVTAWRTPARVRLDLRYAPDEAELLDPTPREIWESLVLSAPAAGADVVGGYAVDDPYGGERGAVIVGGFFGHVVHSEQLTFAAGVTSLLHDLGGLADGGLILAPALVHGDLEAWATSRGSEIALVAEPATADELAAELAAARPALLHLDRPTFTGRLLELAELEMLVASAAAVAAVVVIDESALPYLGGAASAATLVHRTDNLVVLRGFTKAYSLGGLRAGYALASEGVAARVRELVSPLQVGELALQAALRLLAAGDIFGRLRARVAAVKPEVVELLEQAGLEVFPGHPAFPWVAVSDPGGAASRLLEGRGIQALAPTQPPAFPAAAGEMLRLTVPLADDRREAFRRLMRGAEDGF
jgi:histidinol-phosphate/aromatic aminotransferase/cobyric acid decarboxylase-like protein